jgi:transcriptional regulator with XRE-family HTH domain
MSKMNRSFWSSNLRYLRKRKALSQDEMAFTLGISRSKLNAHENGQTINPTVEDLLNFSSYFKFSIDNLIKVDMTKLSETRLRELEAGNDIFTTGTQLRILATSVNAQNKENIEFVSQKAKSGYLSGYSDPEYINKLPVFNMPHLPQNRKFRMFPTTGDSMFPIPENALVIGKYVEDWNGIKDGTPCIIITSEDGIVFKIVTNKIKQDRKLLLSSLNSLYQPYEIAVENVVEIWEFVNYISDTIPQAEVPIQELSKNMHEFKMVLKKLMEKK